MKAKILIVDDDPQIREVIRIALEREGFGTLAASDGGAVLRLAATSKPDLVILDIGLPEMDGLEACRRLRQTSDVPVLFLTARDDEIDRILGLEIGADDYVTKPFSPRELVARVRAILKRTHADAGAKPNGALRHGSVTLHPEAHDCRVDGHAVALTATEMAILETLMRYPARVLSRNQLADALYGVGSEVSGRTVDSHLRNLRNKLGEAGCVDAVDTVHGIGVRMGPCRTE